MPAESAVRHITAPFRFVCPARRKRRLRIPFPRRGKPAPAPPERPSGVLVASDASAKTRKEAAFYCGQAQVPCLELAFTKADFAQMIGRGSGVLAICDDGFFRKMQLLAEQEKQEPRGEA